MPPIPDDHGKGVVGAGGPSSLLASPRRPFAPKGMSCFSPLKRAYGHEIQELAHQGVYHVDKVDFLTIYTQIRPTVLTQQNIQAGFPATGLIPPCPDTVQP
jgi:hypothetical protein